MNNTRYNDVNLKHRKNGFNIIELIVIIGIISVILAIAGNISSKLFLRRSVDNIIFQVGSLLNQTKLQAARQGVEYQLTLNYDETNNILNVSTERGDSNTNSTIYQTISSYQISIPENYTITLPRRRTTHSFNFNPNNTLGGASGSIRIRPAAMPSRISKCGRIVISPFGRIRTVIGRWNFNSNICEGIGDRQEN